MPLTQQVVAEGLLLLLVLEQLYLEEFVPVLPVAQVSAVLRRFVLLQVVGLDVQRTFCSARRPVDVPDGGLLLPGPLRERMPSPKPRADRPRPPHPSTQSKDAGRVSGGRGRSLPTTEGSPGGVDSFCLSV